MPHAIRTIIAACSGALFVAATGPLFSPKPAAFCWKERRHSATGARIVRRHAA